MDLHHYLNFLRANNLLLEFLEEVDLTLDIGNILNEHSSQTVLFHNVKGSSFPLIGNLLPSRKYLELIFSSSNLHQSFLEFVKKTTPCISEEAGSFSEYIKLKSLSSLPIPHFFPSDGGKYLTSGIVFSKFPNSDKVNASIHRIMIKDSLKGIIRLVPRDLYQIHKINKSRNVDTPIAIAIGYNPLLALASSFNVPFGSSEMDVANAFFNHKLTTIKTPKHNISVPSNVEFLIEGTISSSELVEEGPFVDITGTVDDIRPQPVVNINHILHRPNGIFQTIMPASREHFLLMGFPREVQIYEAVSRVIPAVHDVYLTDGGSGWLHVVISITPSSIGDAKNAGFAAFAAHPSLKWCTIVNKDIDIHNAEEVEWATVTRTSAKDIIVIDKVRGSSLDPARNREDQTSIKVLIDATIEGKGDSKGFSKVSSQNS